MHTYTLILERKLNSVSNSSVSFQVNKVLRTHNIKPHWMFALDSIIRKAVQTAITILVPGETLATL